MAIKNYRILKGSVLEHALDDDSSPHIEVLIEENGNKHRAAVNVRSKIAPHALLYERRDLTDTNKIAALRALGDGVIDVPQGLKLDYPGGLVNKSDMEPAPFRAAGVNNDLLEFILPLLDRAIAEDGARIYSWGETWFESGGRDRYFNFSPGRGIHDIHMNQGSSGGFAGSNGRFQDGALAFEFEDGSFVEILLAFQSQSWNNDSNGHPTTEATPSEPAPRDETPNEPAPQNETAGFLQIVAALANAKGDEVGHESVTLINLSDQAVSLQDWKIVDKQGKVEVLGNRSVEAGGTIRLFLHTARLSNKGSTIELQAPDGSVVHRVTYSKADARTNGWSILF